MVDRPTVAEVLPLALWYYRQPGNSTGGSLHVVLDDMNTESCHVRFCMEWALEHGDIAGFFLAWTLLTMTRSQRARVAMACP